jgi:hypothetical protein
MSSPELTVRRIAPPDRFFNEDPVADPFVHVLVGSLPPSRQVLVTPAGCETTGWTPIECPDEADGTIHFTMSHPGYGLFSFLFPPLLVP